jgi:uncharacterized heparinase superfamily protein
MPAANALTLRHPRGSFIGCERLPSMVAADAFVFLNEQRQLHSAGDWSRADWPLLWRYNLHYFDDLVAKDSAERYQWHCDLIQCWIKENPPVSGVGWDPYPISLRAVNWIKFHLMTGGLAAVAQACLAQQIRHLRRRLEYHLLGNHLWANAKALVFAGCFFDDSEADSWRSKGLALVKQQLCEQILADGGHFELSPMYHAIVLEDLLDLIQLGSVYPQLIPDTYVFHWRDTAVRMMAWLSTMTHPDGGIVFFNDATLGIAPPYTALCCYGASVGVLSACDPAESRHLTDSGYVRAQAGPAVLFADVARIGPDYLPGHAHADTLCFELSLFGQRIIVNQGIDRYGMDSERLWQRGTAAHSTVIVDGQNSSEVWSGFRVARRAYPLNPSMMQAADTTVINSSHDGYQRLPGRVTHTRQWQLRPGQLRVTDTLSGKFQTAHAWYHLHPDVKLLEFDRTGADIAVGQHKVRVTVDQGELVIKDSSYNEGFGLKRQTVALQVVFTGEQAVVDLEWI